MTPAADQPGDAAQVRDGDDESAKICVFGDTELAVTVADVFKLDGIAFTEHQRGDIAVDMIKIWQAQKGVAFEHFQATARIISLVFEHPFTHTIAKARRGAFGKCVFAFGTTSANQSQIFWRVCAGDFLEQFRQINRVVLSVPIQSRDNVTPCRQHTRAHRAALARVFTVIEHPQGFVGGLKVYIAWNSGEQQVNRLVMGWFGACIFLVSVGLVINGFFGA